jgi:hypothetical protein
LHEPPRSRLPPSEELGAVERVTVEADKTALVVTSCGEERERRKHTRNERSREKIEKNMKMAR